MIIGLSRFTARAFADFLQTSAFYVGGKFPCAAEESVMLCPLFPRDVASKRFVAALSMILLGSSVTKFSSRVMETDRNFGPYRIYIIRLYLIYAALTGFLSRLRVELAVLYNIESHLFPLFVQIYYFHLA